MTPRRGYVFLVVLLVLVIGLLMVFVGVQRAGAQAAVAQERVRDYQRHHEMLGMRDLIGKWVMREAARRELVVESATLGGDFYDAVLPGNVLVTAHAEDAQGAVLLPHAGVSDQQMVFALNDLVARLPVDRPDLVRSSGPEQISLNAAPEPVLKALAQGDQQLFEILRAMQAEPRMDQTKFVTSLSSVGMSDRATELSRLVAFTPSFVRIWVRVDDGREVRRYSMLADLRTNSQEYVFRSLKYVPGDDTPPLDEQTSPASGAARTP